MSEVQKPVEETPVVVSAVEPVVEAPAAVETAATEAPAAEAPKETPVENGEAAAAPAAAEPTEAPAEQPKEEAKEITPATEGVLGHKGPGLVKGLRFSKRFFYFSDEAVDAKHLSVFQQNEKPAVANPIVAWATQTGKGLLFLTKRAEDKATPAGIFNLAEISDLTKEGSSEFHFKVNGQKHTFQAASAAERDSWFVALEAKAAEAKAEKETIVASEGYKAELEKLTKPVVAEPVKKPVEPKEEAKKEEAAPAEEAKETTEAKDKAKSRSQSRKRASIFGSFLGKKEETEEKKEEKTEDAKPVEAAAEPVAETPATAEGAEAAVAAPAEDKKEETKEEKKAESPAPKAKRASIFGNFFQKVTSPSHEKSEKEAAAPAETSAVSSTAPQLDNPVEEAAVKPIEPETVTAAAATTEAEAPKETAASPTAETPAGKDKRRTSFFGNFGKKKGDSDNEGAEGEKAKGNKPFGLFRKPSKAVKLDNKETPAAKEAEDKAEPTAQETSAEAAPVAEASQPAEAPATEEAKPAAVAATSTPVQAAA
ncbi:hypothetical protein CNMCM5793_004293 [Aspergillus hiratsukae]|uniref:PH domain-containing protein n=1 Tax=Aspergillus hiratsukae TaxID=1194566 RepID=A0A8H6V0P4_9EURO|nr:hypothetical protein CNMCM5793_004293 [Aspergillus hiratsukae]KAF7169670.1 hypothetical protein CNMCM6106_004510 [Aspergillus hiratsukae]